jgi:hypothetical protein
MPNYKKHLYGGIVAYIFILLFIIRCTPSWGVALEWLFCALAGSLFPDIDIKSKGQKYFYHIILILFIILACKQRFVVITCLSFIVIVPLLTKHRGIFHSSVFLIVFPISVWLLMSCIFTHVSRLLFIDTMFFIAGALSHILLDFGCARLFFSKYRRSRR